MRVSTRDALVSQLSQFERVVEIGIGQNTAVASKLTERGTDVVATDVQTRDVPAGVRFVRDDVTTPDRAVYAGADALYALNCPPELHRPTRDLARDIGAAFLFTTLGGDQPLVQVRRETLPGETLFVAED